MCSNRSVSFRYKFIVESLVFKEDDRVERPFIVVQKYLDKISNVWFTMIDLKENKVIKSMLINLKE